MAAVGVGVGVIICKKFYELGGVVVAVVVVVRNVQYNVGMDQHGRNLITATAVYGVSTHLSEVEACHHVIITPTLTPPRRLPT